MMGKDCSKVFMKNDSKAVKRTTVHKYLTKTDKKDRDIDKTMHSILSNTQHKLTKED